MSCHGTQTPPVGEAAPRLNVVEVALVGNPNVGKSTLFNAVTGAKQHVSNAPGTTVELQSGTWRGLRVSGSELRLTDLPGTYSLLARSPDERVTADAVLGAQNAPPDVVIVLVDAANLSRSLYLLAQVADGGARIVVALTMADVAIARGQEVTARRLAEVLGTAVVEVNPRLGTGMQLLEHAVVEAADVAATVVGAAASGGPRARTCVLRGLAPRSCPARAAAAEALADDDLSQDLAAAERLFEWVEQVQRDLLDSPQAAECSCPSRCAHTCPRSAPTECGPEGDGRRPGAHRERRTQRANASDRIDSVLLHPWAGVPVFLAIMWGLFHLATTVATPLMDGVEYLINGQLAGIVRDLMPGPIWLQGFVADGLLAGVGTVLSFAPLMGMMFLAIAFLEDSGYLARAAFMADRAMRAIGLDGRAMLPLIVGFGCNVSALAATRTLPHARQRLLTALLVPYTSCAARLTVYILLASAFFPEHAGTAIFAMYLSSVVLVVLAGLVLRWTAFRDLGQDPLVIVLPTYQRPRLGTLLLSAWVRVRAFLTQAGKIIVLTLLAVWALQAIPVTGDHPIGDVPVQESAYGAAAEAIAPLFAPAGFGDWHASAALVTGFVAKEVVVGAFAQSYAVDEPADAGAPGTLGDRLRATFDETSGGHGSAAALAFMVFVLAYTPCLATVAEQQRMLGARWAWGAAAAQLVIAWCLAVAVFQVGARLWG